MEPQESSTNEESHRSDYGVIDPEVLPPAASAEVPTQRSARRAEANRRNAQRSTGPRSARGRAAVRYNALKHGFFAKQIVLSSQGIGEDPEEFESLLKNLRGHYQPADLGEEMQVEIIALCLWRERRALRCELGEVGHARIEHTRRTRLLHAATDSGSVPGRILQVLRRAELELERTGDLSEATKSTLSSLFSWPELKQMPLVDPQLEQKEFVKQFATWRDRLLSDIRTAIENFEKFQQDGREGEQLAFIERYSIPEAEALNRILKYQSLNDRRLQRALTQLERLQRRRKGDYVPPPLDVSVNGPLGGQ